MIRPTRQPRLGFAGTGWIGRHRLQAVAASGLAEIVALCDPDADALAQARALAPDALLAADFDCLVDCELDGVVIATPSAAHAGQTLAALERGLAVFCQKPLARTAAEVERSVTAARQRDVRLGVDLCYRTLAGMAHARELVANGALGTVFAARAAFHNAYGPDKPWFYDPGAAGGGCFMDLGIHLVDLLLWLLDGWRVQDVRTRLFRGGRRLAPGADEVEDWAEVTLDLTAPDGAALAVAHVATSWGAHAGRDAVVELDLNGTRSGLRLRNVGGSFYDFQVEETVGTRRNVLASPPDAWGGRAITSWVEDLARGDGFDPEIEAQVAVARVIDEVYGR